MRKLPSGEQPDNKAMKHQKGNFFLFMWNYGRDTGNQLAASKSENLSWWKESKFVYKCFDFTLPRTLRNMFLRETTWILQNLRTLLIALLPSVLTCHQQRNSCLCVVISWRPSQTYSAALQSLWPASRDQCSDTVWPCRSVSFIVCQRPQNFLAFITISWRQISGEFLHGTWLLHFWNSSESIRKNHDCNGDRHTR